MPNNFPPPIPVFGVPRVIAPVGSPITLYWHPVEEFNWCIGQIATKGQVEEGIKRCSGLQLPNGILPALAPGDVLNLEDGLFWIDKHWNLKGYHQ